MLEPLPERRVIRRSARWDLASGSRGKSEMKNHPKPETETALEELDLEAEARRIRGVFEERKKAQVPGGTPNFNLYARYIQYERNGVLINALRKLNVKTLAGMKILDVGCGGGTLLRHLYDFGVKPKDCFGADVLEDTLRGAKELSPNAGFFAASAARLPIVDETFDLVFQSMVFTSVLNPKIKRVIASEILRVLKKGGRFVWYDFTYDNPRNPHVKGVGRREIRELLPGCRLHFWRLTLAPPIGRITAAWSPFLFHLLSQMPFLCTHCLCIAEKQ
jgi:ubiquinone/menaquinone biosynthesis C-methylase UbiE